MSWRKEVVKHIFRRYFHKLDIKKLRSTYRMLLKSAVLLFKGDGGEATK
jgi:hypothetical protein